MSQRDTRGWKKSVMILNNNWKLLIENQLIWEMIDTLQGSPRVERRVRPGDCWGRPFWICCCWAGTCSFFYCILSAILFFDFFEIPQVSSQDLSVILLFEFFSIFKCHRLAPRLWVRYCFFDFSFNLKCHRLAPAWVCPLWWSTSALTSAGTATTTSTNTGSASHNMESTFSTQSTQELRTGSNSSLTLCPTLTGDFYTQKV